MGGVELRGREGGPSLSLSLSPSLSLSLSLSLALSLFLDLLPVELAHAVPRVGADLRKVASAS